MDDYNKQAGPSSSGESDGNGRAGTAARMKEQAASKVADVKEKSANSAAKPLTSSTNPVHPLPAPWNRPLLRSIRAVTNCRVPRTPPPTKFRPVPTMFAKPTCRVWRMMSKTWSNDTPGRHWQQRLSWAFC